jgi:hypothetical protein
MIRLEAKVKQLTAKQIEDIITGLEMLADNWHKVFSSTKFEAPEHRQALSRWQDVERLIREIKGRKENAKDSSINRHYPSAGIYPGVYHVP